MVWYKWLANGMSTSLIKSTRIAPGVEVPRRRRNSKPTFSRPCTRDGTIVAPRMSSLDPPRSFPEVKPGNISAKSPAQKALHEASASKGEVSRLLFDLKSAKAPEVIGGNVKNLINLFHLASTGKREHGTVRPENRGGPCGGRLGYEMGCSSKGARLKPEWISSIGVHMLSEYDNADKQNLTDDSVPRRGKARHGQRAHYAAFPTLLKLSTFFSGPGYAIYVTGQGRSHPTVACACGGPSASTVPFLQAPRSPAAGELKVVDGWLRFSVEQERALSSPSVPLHLLQVLHIPAKEPGANELSPSGDAPER